MKFTGKLGFLVLVVCLFFSFSNLSGEPPVGGTIVFDDGRALRFEKMVSVMMDLFEANKPNPFRQGIFVKFENSIRSVPYSKLKRLRVVSFETRKTTHGKYFAKGRVEVTTVTGITVRCWYDSLRNIKVRIMDKLTGEMKEQEFNFVNIMNGKLYVREIFFNN